MAFFSKQNLLDILLKTSSNNLVFRYKGNPPFHSSTHHIFIIMARMVNSGDLILVNGTSKVDERLSRLETMGIDVDRTTVRISSKKYNFFPKETLIDCNSVNVLSPNEIKIDNFEYVRDGKMLEEDFAKIKQAVIASSLVEPYIKNNLKD